MEGKKISFGFMKTKKAAKPVIEEKKEFIECLEEKSVKVIGGEVVEKEPLVIPLQPNTIVTAERLKQIADEVEKSIEDIEPSAEDVKTGIIIKQEPTDDAETLDQMVVRELMEDAKKVVKVENNTLSLPLPAKPVLDGQKESTLEDYEAVPIKDYGLAMLRGMGWTPGNEQNDEKSRDVCQDLCKQSPCLPLFLEKYVSIFMLAKLKEPKLRPKGLGLGADKVVKQNQKSSKPEDKDLTIVKNAFVKITTGKHSGCYGKVVSLDEDNGRVMVDLAATKETVSLSEFMMQPVPKAEYDKESRVINADKFEEYKKKEQPQKTSRESQDDSKKYKDRQSTSKSSEVSKEQHRREGSSSSKRSDERSSNGKCTDKETRHRDSSNSEERYKREKDKKRYSSNESLSTSDDERRRKKERKKHDSESDSSDADKKHKKSKKHRKRDGTPEGKRDIDKKRKGKKKRRDRDRSPNYKKHRK